MLRRLIRDLINRQRPSKILGKESAHPESICPPPAEDPFDANMQQGVAYFSAHNYSNAIACLTKVPPGSPQYGEALHLMGLCQKELGNLQAAIHFLNLSTQIRPTDAQTWYHLAVIEAKCRQRNLAVDHYRKVLELDPSRQDAWNNLGVLLQDLGQPSEAVRCYRAALKLAALPETFNNLTFPLLQIGKVGEALNACEEAIKLAPAFLRAHRSLLTAALYSSELSLEEVYGLHRQFEAKCAEKLYPPNISWSNLRDAKRRIKIGYVSSDFRNHPVGYNIAPLIEHHDRTQFEIFLYSNVSQPTEMTQWFEQKADHWRNIFGKSDDEAATMIRADGIDILVMLAARFDDNRPLICAYRPAPIQVSFHDPATSGLKVMDYLITDITMSPCDTKEQFTERLIRLPTFYVHAPIVDAPEVSPLPALKNGYITFGSFNNPAKINSRVISAWASILRRTENSRILLKYNRVFGDSVVQERIKQAFAQHEISLDRIVFDHDIAFRTKHLSLYQQVDISLDTFPFTGSTTTFESLWMGVPVVTLAGPTMVSRWSASMLRRVALDTWISKNTDEYIELAIALASQTAILAELRQSLRELVMASSLCNGIRHTRHLEHAYRAMSRKWAQQTKE